MKKTLAALSAIVLAASACLPGFAGNAADSYAMSIRVDMTDAGKPISPYIYGINDAGMLNNVTVNAVRQGGNRFSGYNWENNYSNAGSDWQHSSDTYLTNGYSSSLAKTPGACAIHLSDDCAKYNIPYKTTTIQMCGYVSADADGAILDGQEAPSSRWKQVKAAKGSAFSMTPDTEDDYVYMDEYVNYLVNTLGDSTTATGINGYNLDNEPSLWSSTHAKMHPDKTTYKEMVDKSTEYAAAIKSVDPNADVLGLALFGYYAYTGLNEAPDQDSSYNWFISYYLDQMRKAEETAGMRLIDAIDVHYYSEAKGETRVTESSATSDADNAARVQAPRTLYEKGYIENSWIGQWGGSNLPILPTIQSSIDTYYPGTKIAMTEYNFGGGDHITGAIAEADVLGAFADNDVYLATLWPLSGSIDYQLAAIDLYTNYDGKGSSFGDTLIKTETSDIEKSTAYAAVDAGDDSVVTVMVTNKDASTAEDASIVLEGAKDSYKSAAVYAVYGDSSDIRLIDVVDVDGTTANVTLPAYSAAMVVITKEASDLEVEPEPEIRTESVVFDDPESMIGANDFISIPIEDPEHLKKVILTADVTSSAGSTWGTAGCALSINAVTPEGEGFWTHKDYTIALGSGKTATVNFDGTFSYTNEDESTSDVAAVIADGKIELQKWWDASEQQEAGNEDTISVTYTKVEVIYEYTEEEPTQAPTEAQTDAPEPTDAETPTDAQAPTQSGLAVTIWGDADDDGDCDIIDVITVNKEQLGSETLSAQGAVNADVDRSGALSFTDAVNIMKSLVDLVTLPVEE